jgi:hypothetical protein
MNPDGNTLIIAERGVEQTLNSLSIHHDQYLFLGVIQMKQRISRLYLTLLTVTVLMLGAVPSVRAQEPSADLALSKSADRKNVKIG